LRTCSPASGCSCIRSPARSRQTLADLLRALLAPLDAE
jgi:hypothetical protein